MMEVLLEPPNKKVTSGDYPEVNWMRNPVPAYSGPWYDAASQYESVGKYHHALEVFEEEEPLQVHENTGSVLHQVPRHKQLHPVLLNVLVFR
jgi:hypothetical protein